MSVRAKKYLGQHFLNDENIAAKIANTLTEKGYNHILEVGPGMGILTKYLLQKKAEITVIEIDDDSVEYLETYFRKSYPNSETLEVQFKIIKGDFLKQSIAALFNRQQVAIIGNYPYNISSQIIFKTIEYRAFIPELSGMFQKEVAERIAEKKGSKVYGILSVLTQTFFDVEYLFTVPSTVFQPPPKVSSGVIRLLRKEDFLLPVDEQFFFKIVKTAFGHRRKMLRTSLKFFNISDTLKEDAIFAKRPEQLSVEEFIELTHKITIDVV